MPCLLWCSSLLMLSQFLIHFSRQNLVVFSKILPLEVMLQKLSLISGLFLDLRLNSLCIDLSQLSVHFISLSQGIFVGLLSSRDQLVFFCIFLFFALYFWDYYILVPFCVFSGLLSLRVLQSVVVSLLLKQMGILLIEEFFLLIFILLSSWSIYCTSYWISELNGFLVIVVIVWISNRIVPLWFH